jgi:hypothetical protein
VPNVRSGSRSLFISTDHLGDEKVTIKKHILFPVVVLAAITVSESASAIAVSLAPASGSTEVNSNNPFGDVSNPGIPSSASLQGGTATLSALPFVSLQAQVADPAGVATQDAFVNLSYQFAVVGGTPGVQVPIFVQTNLFTSADPNATAFVEFNVNGIETTVCTNECAGPATFDGTLSFTVTSGTAIPVSFFIGAENTFSFGGSAFASADPFFFVDPTFADAKDYSIVLSDGIGNGIASGVPEPSTWAMMILGFAGISVMTYRRRRSAMLAA